MYTRRLKHFASPEASPALCTSKHLLHSSLSISLSDSLAPPLSLSLSLSLSLAHSLYLRIYISYNRGARPLNMDVSARWNLCGGGGRGGEREVCLERASFQQAIFLCCYVLFAFFFLTPPSFLIASPPSRSGCMRLPAGAPEHGARFRQRWGFWVGEHTEVKHISADQV